MNVFLYNSKNVIVQIDDILYYTQLHILKDSLDNNKSLSKDNMFVLNMCNKYIIRESDNLSDSFKEFDIIDKILEGCNRNFIIDKMFTIIKDLLDKKLIDNVYLTSKYEQPNILNDLVKLLPNTQILDKENIDSLNDLTVFSGDLNLIKIISESKLQNVSYVSPSNQRYVDVNSINDLLNKSGKVFKFNLFELD